MKPTAVLSLVAAVSITLMVVACTPTDGLVRAMGHADVASEIHNWSALFWLPPGLFEDWDETTVLFSASTGLQARGRHLPDDRERPDADLTFRLGAPFDEEMRLRGSIAERKLKWSTTDCALGCFLEVPVEIQSNVELPEGVTWSTNWTLSIVFPDEFADGDDLGSHGWVVAGDGTSPNRWTAAGPEELELEPGVTITRLVTLSIADGASSWGNPIARIALSPTEVQALDAWIPVEVGVDTSGMGGLGLSADSDDWLTASSSGVVGGDQRLAEWQLAEPRCSGCTLRFAVSFRSDRQTTLWWIPMLHSIPLGSKLTISSA